MWVASSLILEVEEDEEEVSVDLFKLEVEGRGRRSMGEVRLVLWSLALESELDSG